MKEGSLKFSKNKITRQRVIKLRVVIVMILSILLSKILFSLFGLQRIIKDTKTLANLFKNKNKISLNEFEIYKIFLRIKNFLKLKSCLKNCIALKIAYSALGYQVLIQSGVKLDKYSKLDGHAWIVYDEIPIIEADEEIDGYIKSFTI